jgi:hypothetical protein
MDGIPEFHTKSILIRPYHFAFSFNTVILFAIGHGHRYDISFGQKQIGFNKCTFVAQVFDVTLVDAVSSREKGRLGAKFSRIFSFIFHQFHYSMIAAKTQASKIILYLHQVAEIRRCYTMDSTIPLEL